MLRAGWVASLHPRGAMNTPHAVRVTPRARLNGPAFVLGWVVGLGALGTLVLLAGVNPKNLLLTVAAAAAIAETGISAAQQELALAVFVVIGTLGPGIPVAIYFVLGERSKKLLDGLNSWMAANNAVIMAVLLLVIGVKLVGDGIAGL
jgi:hypothetical protein